MLAHTLVNPLRKEYGLDGLFEEFLDAELSGGDAEGVLAGARLLLHALKDACREDG